MITGTDHFPAERDVEYSRMAIGIAWPGLRPGFVVVVGEQRCAQVMGRPRLDVLDEDSDERLWHVVAKAAALWLGLQRDLGLSDRQLAVAIRLVLGDSIGQIAERLGLSKWTIVTHVRRLKRKTKTAARAQLVIELMLRSGLLLGGDGQGT